MRQAGNNKLIYIALSFLFTFLTATVFADIVIDHSEPDKAPELNRNNGTLQIDIVNPKDEISYNKFTEFSCDEEQIIIRNNYYDQAVLGIGLVKCRDGFKPAKTIILEVTGNKISQLIGKINIVGDISAQVNLIVINPNGIMCSGASFINTRSRLINTVDVQLRTDKLLAMTKDQENWQQDLTSSIYVGQNGTVVHNGSLTMSAGTINITGAISVKSLLRVEAHAAAFLDPVGPIDPIDMLYAKYGRKSQNNSKITAIEVNTSLPITAGNIRFITTGNGAGISLTAPKFILEAVSTVNIYIAAKKGDITIIEVNTGPNGSMLLDGKNITVQAINEAQRLIINGNKINGDFEINNTKNLEIAQHTGTMDFNLTKPIKIAGEFKFAGRSFKNANTFEAESVKMDLAGDFINTETGSITTSGPWQVESKNFTNYYQMNIGGNFIVEAKSFVNDQGGVISANIIEVFATGTNDSNYSLYQSSNSVIEARTGNLELITPSSGMYFGYKKVFTRAGDNHDGFEFIGSKLTSQYGLIHLQSGKDIVFEGAQVVGNSVVKAVGEIKEIDLEAKSAYKNGTRIITVKENATRVVPIKIYAVRIVPIKIRTKRTVPTKIKATRNVTKRIDAICNATKKEFYLSYELVGCTPGCCGSILHCKCCPKYDWIKCYRKVVVQEQCWHNVIEKEHYLKDSTKEEYYLKDSTKEEHYLKDSTKEETYIKETTQTQDYFQDVTLKANFIGNKQIANNQADLTFKSARILYADITQAPDDEFLLKFVSDPTQVQPANDGQIMYQYFN